MIRLRGFLSLLAVGIACFGTVCRADEGPGHSRHGTAFDSGLRQKPWKMEGIGHSHFPITTKVPDVQEWFDQGNTLLPPTAGVGAPVRDVELRAQPELSVHSTVLIDTRGRVHWKRTGGKPFADVEFLMQAVKRMNEMKSAQAANDPK
jgi:hypothetical protein